MYIVLRFLKHPRLQYALSYAIFSALVLTIMGCAVLVAGVWAFSLDLPSPDNLTHRSIPQSTEIYDRNGELLYQVYRDQNRTLVELKDVPQVVIDATLAAEDKNFYSHPGIDIGGLAFATYQTFFNGSIQGGSTITQQLVKKALLTDERTIQRKVKEAILSLRIEQRYTKSEILQMYLNEVPYGGQVYGIKAAAETYFDKDLEELTLSEAALLAGLPQSPTNYSPFDHPKMALDRQQYVLNEMVRAGYITAEQKHEAAEAELALASPEAIFNAPWFALWVKDMMIAEYGRNLVEEGGLRITTTLDMEKQRIAEEEVNFQIDRLKQANANASQGALLSMDPKSGQILAMVGSRDYFDVKAEGNVNATLTYQQPGSAIKPFVYLAGFQQKKITPATRLNDVRTAFNAGIGQPPYIPRESDGKYWGPMLVRDALANSRNIPTVQVMERIGLSSMISTTEKAGIATYANNNNGQYGLSLSLGAGEVRMLDLANAYATIANKGVRQEPVAVLRVETADGRVLYDWEKPKGEKQFDQRYTYLITDILSDNAARSRLFGPNNQLELASGNRPAAVKTGTTDDNRDAWTVGYTPSIVTAVWVGNFDNTPMNGVMGATGATPIWHYYMSRVLDGTPIERFEKPEGLVEVPITSSGQPACSRAGAYRVEIFVKGTEPDGGCWPFRTPGGEYTPPTRVAGEQILRQQLNGRPIEIQHLGNGRIQWRFSD